MRLPFFRAKPEAEPLRPAAKRAERARGPAPEAGPADVNAARTRARQRLVGALVLLLVGVVGFPVLFETQPRPLPLDIPIQVGAREPGEATPPPATLNRPLPVTSLPADAGSEVVPAAVTVAASAAPAAPGITSRAGSAPAVAAPAPRPSAPLVAAAPPPRPAASAPARPVVSTTTSAPAPATAAAPVRTESARASALLAGSSPGAASAAANVGRFVVQVGAYTDARTLKDARGKVEKLGLQTYTQVIDGDAGKRTRVRLGPYATRAEAEAAADKLKRAGLPANILAL
jgi:DedD protein